MSPTSASVKVLVVNAYVRENAGDAALLSVCLAQVRRAFPEASIRFSGMESPELHTDFESYPNIGSIRRYVADGNVARSVRILRRLLVMAILTLILALPAALRRSATRLLPDEVRAEFVAVGEADLVVSLGGGYVHARQGLSGYQNVFFVLLPIVVAHRAGVPVVCAPQSYGPFATQVQRRFVFHVLRRCALVLVREDISMCELAACGLVSPHVQRSVDSAFAFRPAKTKTAAGARSSSLADRPGLSTGRPVVAVTARRWLSTDAQERYERALAQFVDRLIVSGYQVVLVPQVTSDYLADDDRIVEERITEHCEQDPVRLTESLTCHEVATLYGSCDYVVGTRFHSVIFSLTALVPCIAIEYEHKTRGIMTDLGLERWVVMMEDVTPDILDELFRRLVMEREGYRTRLEKIMPSYREQADELTRALRVVVEGARA